MASTNREFTYSSLNFDDIKESLINAFKNDKTFSDYNFEGAGLNILMDILAYVTHMTAVTANISANEMFMDSAQLRQSIVSKAKELGYRPYSGTAPQARLKITFTIPNTAVEKRHKITIPAGTQFGCAFNTVFSTKDEYVLFPTGYVYQKEGDPNESQDEKAFLKDENNQNIITHTIFEGEIIVYEGYYHEIQYIIDYGNPDQRLYIPSDKVDLTTLKVRTITGTTVKTYSENDNLNVLTPDSLVYFIHQNPDNLFEVTFGDGILGYKPEDLSVVVFNFIAYDKGKEMNGLKKITKLQMIDGTNKYDIEMLPLEGEYEAMVSGGEDMESGEQIRYRSTKMWKTQNRAVTREDYETLLLAEYPWIDCLTVWGGQYNDPPQYGKVFIAVKPKHTDKVAFYLKEKIKQELIKKYNTVTCIPEIVDVDYIYVGVKTQIKYDKSVTTLTEADLLSMVDESLETYFRESTGKFDQTIYLSPINSTITNIDQCVIAATSKFFIEKRIYPKLYSSEIYSISFSNELVPNTLESSIFNTGTESVYVPCVIKDDGEGKMHVWRTEYNDDKPFIRDIGTIDYKTGDVKLNLICYKLPESKDIKFYAETVDEDISCKHHQIILKDENVANHIWNIRPGIDLSCVNVTKYQK